MSFHPLTSIKTAFILSLLFFNSFLIEAQKLVDSNYLSSTTKEEILTEYGILPDYDVDMYRILYETLDIHNNLDTASGMLIIPADPDLKFPLLIYEHGTLSVREDVPSNLGGGYQLGMILSAYGYIGLAPDYLGLGTARGFHPFVHAESEASASIDMLIAVKTYLAENEIAHNDQLFVTGYSQGGHSAMATHRALELDYAKEFTVTATSPMSGPYSISDKMIVSTLGDQEFFYPGFLIYTSLSYRLAYPELLDTFTLDKILKPPYLDVSRQFENREISISSLNNQLNDILIAEVGAALPKEMLQDHILEAILNDPDFVFNQTLRWNDVFDWAPQAPTRLYYCMADDQVYFENSLIAEETMNNLGAFDVMAFDLGSTLDHGQCITPATINTIVFFSFFRDISSSSADLNNHRIPIHLYPNPATNHLILELPDFPEKTDIRVVIYDISGQLIFEGQWSHQKILDLDIRGLQPGMYFLQLAIGNHRIQKKFVKK